MTFKIITQNHLKIAVIQNSGEIIINDTQSALDLMATVRYEADCDRIVIPKSAVTEDFFVLSTGLAGEILQKFVTYQFMAAFVGDFSRYKSQPLRDFIYESNRGNQIFFVADEDEAISKLAGV